ncbi:MAG TPA: DUF2268 domain-containing putative Zn-dependent protease [Acidimicrobiales bacterium]|nr:DUF2268 domain-containing putative Zn-dependent protease [Acidimicrobiales bacterium]
MSLLVLLCVAVAACSVARDDDGAEFSSGDATREGGEAAFVVVVDVSAARLGNKIDVDVERVARPAARAAFSKLPALDNPVQIEVTVDRERPTGYGVSGFTDPESGNVSVWLHDRPRLALSHVLERLLPATIIHEAHHAARVRVGPGYGTTLGEAIVTEGLAEQFVTEVLEKPPVPSTRDALDEAQRAEVWRRAQPNLWSAAYDHEFWFFGTGDVPRWAGYSIGFHIVGHYRDAHAGVAPSHLVGVAARDVLAAYDP